MYLFGQVCGVLFCSKFVFLGSLSRVGVKWFFVKGVGKICSLSGMGDFTKYTFLAA